ncbi:archaeosortase family protein ArtE [Methanococcus sp. CF]
MNEKLKNYFLILLKYFGCSLLIYLVLSHFESYLIKFVAYHSYILLKCLLNDAYIFQNTIFLSNVSILVIEPCTGILSISIVLGSVVAVEKKLKYLILGSVFCALLIYLGNIFRIVIIGILANNFGNAQYIHNSVSLVSGPLMAVTTILIWFKIREKLIDTKLDE